MDSDGNREARAVESIASATLRAPLQTPVQIGDRYLYYREYTVVRARTVDGVEGWSYGLSRNGPVAEAIRYGLSDLYKGTLLAEREDTFWSSLRSSPASFGSGIGLRGLSLVDLAMWDATGKHQGRPVAEILGGSNDRTPASCIVGYPPNVMDPEECAKEIADLSLKGFQRFKAPIASDRQLAVAQLEARREKNPSVWIALDAAWSFADAESANEFLRRVQHLEIGWLEDIFLPGDMRSLETLREMTTVRIAMGDDQGDAYYPDALIRSGSVDVLRFDLTCMGGVTRGKRVVQRILEAGLEISPHIFAPIHTQFLGGLGILAVACEWSEPDSGVDPFTESLERPVIGPDGYADAPQRQPGFGQMVNFDWIQDQVTEDPSHILNSRPVDGQAR